MGKTKTFICTIPFQKEGSLKPIVYKAHGNSKLDEYGTKYGQTRFPIVPVINGYAEKGDRIRVIAIVSEGENFRHNYDTYFVDEVNNIVKENKYVFDGIEKISTPDEEGIEAQLKLLAELLDKINDNEEVSACITYGTKPLPIVQFIALNYAGKIKADTTIGCIAYGRFLHTEEEQNIGRIWDQTALFYIDSIVSKLAQNQVKNPDEVIKAWFDLEDAEYVD